MKRKRLPILRRCWRRCKRKTAALYGRGRLKMRSIYPEACSPSLFSEGKNPSEKGKTFGETESGGFFAAFFKVAFSIGFRAAGFGLARAFGQAGLNALGRFGFR